MIHIIPSYRHNINSLYTRVNDVKLAASCIYTSLASSGWSGDWCAPVL